MMNKLRIGLLGLCAAALAALPSGVGCSAAGEDANAQSGAGESGGGHVGAGGSGGGHLGAGGFDLTTSGSAGGSRDPSADRDGDGFTPAGGDCNDDDKNVNPGAIEVKITEPDGTGQVPAPADEDCDGVIDNVAPPCDDGLSLDDFDPMSGAKAIDLCTAASRDDRRWGVLDARYVRGSGEAAATSSAVGLLGGFGPNVRVQGGARLLALSTGSARLPGQPDACFGDSCSAYGPGSAPRGFPQDNPDCIPSELISDDIGLEVTLRAPTNATGYGFRFKFYTFEFPEWVCLDFNDQFIALATPPPPGSYNGNLSFDSAGRPVSVNFAFFDVCDGCPSGRSELEGTGFQAENNWFTQSDGGTRWLETEAPVTGGQEITLRFMIFDTGDDRYDSTALVDGFHWIARGGAVAVGTAPVENPR